MRSVKFFKQNISRSLKISRQHKKYCYGHYCNLVKKYNFDRIAYKYFTPIMILEVEYKYLNKKRSDNIFAN